MELTLEIYIKIRNFIYDKTGILFEDKKIYFVKKRLKERVSALSLDSALDYLRYLKFSDPDARELQNFINLLTTNETYFFREYDQLAAFAEHCLAEVCEEKQKRGDKRLKVWSAACSTGEEVYTLEIILREMMEDFHKWQTEIIGTDIDTTVLQKAERGVYSKRSVKDVPPEYLTKYFTESNGEYMVRAILKNGVSLRRLNFMNSVEMARFRGFDFIFCRNVLIYFDEESRRKVVSHLHDSLAPGGYIFLGHSESMSRISTAFKLKRKGGFLVYQKKQ